MAEALAFHRRTMVRSSLSKLGTKLTELETDTSVPTLLENAKDLADKLKTLLPSSTELMKKKLWLKNNEPSMITMTKSLNSIYVFNV